MRCPHCNTDGPVGARFCHACGRRLTEHAQAEQASEHRNLTVLFCDLVGSTRLTADLGAETMAQVLGLFQSSVAAITMTFGGRVGRFMGDGVFAHFSYPEAHEDDAERAILAALEMVQVVADLGTPAGRPLQARVGVATGRVMIGGLFGDGRQIEVVGDAPNLAARLQECAGPGEIVIAPRTRRLLGSGFLLESLPEIELKGFAEPVRPSRVLAVRDLESRFQARESRGLVPLVGRAAELQALEAAWDRAKGGHGGMILIVGEPGIGKSRLAEAFRQSLPRDGFTSVRYQSSPHHRNSTLHPITQQMAHAAGLRTGMPDHERLQRIEALLEGATTDLAQAVPFVAPLHGIPCPPRYTLPQLGPAQIKRRTFEVLLEQFLGLARQGPVLAVFEDLHWTDPTTLELFDLVVPRLAGLPILMLATHRPEFVHHWPEPGPMRRIALDRLDRVASTEMVRALTGDARLAGRIVREIVDKTDGVPLFIEEMTRSVLESGADGDPASQALAVPDSLHDTLMARLDRFSSVKQVAQTAAVIGREFPLGLLRAIAPVQGAALQSALATLVDVGLVLRRRGEGESQYVFKHVLLQEEAYSSLLRSTRVQLHARLAAAIEAHHPATAAREPEVLAYHLQAADKPADAVRYWLAAGELSVERSAFIEAIAHLSAGLGLIAQLPPGDQRDRVELLLQTTLGRAYFAVKGFGAVETAQAFRRALELGRRVEDTPELFPVMHGVVAYLTVRGRFDEAYELADELVERARLQGEPTPLLIAHRAIGFASFVIGRLEAAETHLKTTLAVYEPERHAPLARVLAQDLKATALAYLLLTELLQGREEDALKTADAAIAHVDDLDHLHSRVAVLAFVAGMHLIRGEPEPALALAEETARVSAAHGYQLWQSGGIMLGGAARARLGEPEAGIAAIQDGIARLDAVGATIWGDYARLLLAEALAANGAIRPAHDEVMRGIAATEGTAGRWYEAELHRLRAQLDLALGHPLAEAETSLRRALIVAERQGANLWYERARRAADAIRR